MRLLCLNIWGGKVFAPLMDYLRNSRADVLCLQEVIHSPDSRKDWLTYRDGAHVLDQRARLFSDIAAALPGHRGIFCPAARGVLWDGDRAFPSFWGIATFVRAELPLIGQTQGFVHKDFSADGYGDHPRSRTAHAVRLFDPGRNRTVTIAHMHGLRDPVGKADTPARRLQARRFAAMIEATAGAQDEVAVCGDFNVDPGSETLTTLAALGLTDLVTTRGFAGTRTALYEKPGRFADYMLVNARLTVSSFDVPQQPEVSDHCPLCLSF